MKTIMIDGPKKKSLVENEKLATELIIANKELILQNKEKEKRAAELIIANRELAYQNEEKEKRADELVVANDARRETNEYLENLLDYANAPIIVWNAQYEITRFNKAFESLTGRTENDVIGQSLEILFPPISKDSSMEIIKKTLEGDRLDVVEIDILNIDGSVKTLQWNSANIMSPDGKTPVATIAQGNNITFRKQAEQKLIIVNKELAFQNEEKEKRAAELIIANKELVYQNEEKEKRAAELIIANKELVYQNEEKEKLAAELIIANKELAFQNEEKEKRAAELIIANKELVFQNKEKENRADELAIANKELIYQNEEKENRAAELIIANKELVFQSEQKEKRANELVIANKELVYQNEEKEKRAFELGIADKELAYQTVEKEKRADELIIADKELAYQTVEKKKRAAELVIADEEIIIQQEEKEMQIAANKELEAFSYSVSHDLRAPLRHIGGFVDLLIKNNSAQLDVTGLRYLNIISESSHEMGNLIDALLSFSRLSRAELLKAKINTKNMVSRVLKTFSDDFANRDIKTNISELPDVMGDEHLINQVWINLISNALKYSKNKEKAVIEIGSNIENDKIIFYVKDNGAGFDMKYADKLFGVFQRLHKAKDFEGIGIGLANVNRIVTRHGGKCWAESEVDKGATFFFSLPNN